jgi:hypothetical protein
MDHLATFDDISLATRYRILRSGKGALGLSMKKHQLLTVQPVDIVHSERARVTQLQLVRKIWVMDLSRDHFAIHTL